MRTLKKILYVIKLFLGLTPFFFIISCSAKATSPAGYIRFHPEQGSLLEIEFDYPENWVIQPDPSNELDTFLIYDPAGSMPTHQAKFQSYEPAKWGRIYITVYQVINPVEEMNKAAAVTEKWKKIPHPENIYHITAKSRSEILENLTGEIIDGAHSHQLTSRITVEWQGDKYVEIYRMFEFARGDRLYHFEIIIPEKDINNDFAKAFEYMISSIRFIR